MTDSPTSMNANVSRRRMLQIAVAGGGVLVAATLPGAAAASSKVAKTAVAYQPKPKGSADCDNCAQWLAPNACKLVAGDISPSGWCGIWSKKA